MGRLFKVLAALVAAVGAVFAFLRLRRGRKDEESGS